MNPLYFDIESVITTRPDYRDRVVENIKPPATMSKPETIAKWESEQKENAIDAVVEKSVFDGGLCHVAQINYAFGDKEAVVRIMDGHHDEEIIKEFYADVEANAFDILVGHNVIEFDLRVIVQRSMVLRLKIPALILKAAKCKPWDDFVFDTMTRWAGVKGYVSMDQLCYYLGIDSPKKEMDGSMYGEYFSDTSKHPMLAKYGFDEIKALREVYAVMAGQI